MYTFLTFVSGMKTMHSSFIAFTTHFILSWMFIKNMIDIMLHIG
ncbi:hypothetical protein AB54_4922 [Escherichia coli 2-011-08_S1_C3]|nr:hypothetical protein AB54_4922 [Escherichia coli 2-011-08_S1_C3]